MLSTTHPSPVHDTHVYRYIRYTCRNRETGERYAPKKPFYNPYLTLTHQPLESHTLLYNRTILHNSHHFPAYTIHHTPYSSSLADLYTQHNIVQVLNCTISHSRNLRWSGSQYLRYSSTAATIGLRQEVPTQQQHRRNL